MRFLSAEPDAAFVPIGEAKILRSLDGQAYPLDAALQAVSRDGRVLVAAAPSKLTAMLAERRIPVFADAETFTAHVIARFLATRERLGIVGFVRGALGFDHREDAMNKVAHPESVMVHVTVERKPPPTVRELLMAAKELLHTVDVDYREIHLGEIDSGPGESRLFVLGRELAPVMALPPRGVYERGMLERPSVVVNRHHPHLRRLAETAAQQPELAAYCLAKSLMMEEDRARHADLRLIDSVTKTLRPSGRGR